MQIQKKTNGLWTSSDQDERNRLFGRRYFDDPVGFVTDCIIWPDLEDSGPTPYQAEIMAALPRERRVSFRSCHGAGKTTLSAWIILWFALTRDALGADWKIPTTASAWRQLQKFLWPEVHKWSKRVNWQRIGRNEFASRDELQSLSLTLNHGSAFALASNRSDLIEGAHADHLLYVFDESKVIPEATWDSAEGAMTTPTAMWLAVSTPGEPQGRFYHIHTRRPGTEDWWVRHVKMQEVIDAGRMSEKWVEDRKAQWGEQSAEFQKRVLGEFAVDEAEGLIPLSWVEAAIARWEAWERKGSQRDLGIPTQVGVDVARSGKDNSVIAVRHGDIITKLDIHSKLDTMEIAGYVAPYLRDNQGTLVQIDIIGVGSGVYDRLCEIYPTQADRTIMAFHVQESTKAMDRTELFEFSNSYSAAWWRLRELLDPTYGATLALPPEDSLVADLTAPTWRVLSNGKIQVEPKEDVKKRLGRSPDCGDAVVLATWEPESFSMEFA